MLKAIAFDGANIWVATAGSDDVTKISAADGAMSGNFNTGTEPLASGVDGHLVENIDTAGMPLAVAFDGVSLWIATQSPDSLLRVPVR